MTSPASTRSVPKHVTVCEVGPRDGLQNEPTAVSADDKVSYINLLLEAGFRDIEVTSFVNPKAVPQLADAEAVFPRVHKLPGRRYICLVPNERGLDRALTAGAQAIAVFTAASDSFAKRNIGMTIDESIATFARVVKRAKNDGIWVRASISTAFGCPFEGTVPVANVVCTAERLLEIGVDEISVADTIGVGTPNQVYDIIDALAGRVPFDRLGLHFHDTRGTALANVVAALHAGIHIFDRPRGVWAAAHSPRARPATSRPKTCSTCSTEWASKRASISPRSAPRHVSSAASSPDASIRVSTPRSNAFCRYPYGAFAVPMVGSWGASLMSRSHPHA